jgi:hypothetical protein
MEIQAYSRFSTFPPNGPVRGKMHRQARCLLHLLIKTFFLPTLVQSSFFLLFSLKKILMQKTLQKIIIVNNIMQSFVWWLSFEKSVNKNVMKHKINFLALSITVHLWWHFDVPFYTIKKPLKISTHSLKLQF